MSDPIAIALIAAGTILLFTVIVGLFGTSGNAQESTVDLWIAAHKETKLAKLAIMKTEAEHERRCPWLTDTPRERL